MIDRKTADHRARLRFFGALAGRMRLDLEAELVTKPHPTAVATVPFVRDGDALRPADTPNAPDVSGSPARSRRWVMLPERRSDRQVYAEADVRAEAVPYGPPRRRLFTVRFVAVADFDVLEAIGVGPYTGSWDALTEIGRASCRE